MGSPGPRAFEFPNAPSMMGSPEHVDKIAYEAQTYQPSKAEEYALKPNPMLISELMDIRRRSYEAAEREVAERTEQLHAAQRRMREMAEEIRKLHAIEEEFGNVPWEGAYKKWRYRKCQTEGCRETVDLEDSSTGDVLDFAGPRCRKCICDAIERDEEAVRGTKTRA